MSLSARDEVIPDFPRPAAQNLLTGSYLDDCTSVERSNRCHGAEGFAKSTCYPSVSLTVQAFPLCPPKCSYGLMRGIKHLAPRLERRQPVLSAPLNRKPANFYLFSMVLFQQLGPCPVIMVRGLPRHAGSRIMAPEQDNLFSRKVNQPIEAISFSVKLKVKRERGGCPAFK